MFYIFKHTVVQYKRSHMYFRTFLWIIQLLESAFWKSFGFVWKISLGFYLFSRKLTFKKIWRIFQTGSVFRHLESAIKLSEKNLFLTGIHQIHYPRIMLLKIMKTRSILKWPRQKYPKIPLDIALTSNQIFATFATT